MSTGKINTADNERKVIVLKPLKGVKYYKLKNTELYFDIEKAAEIAIEKGIEFLDKTVKKYLENR